MLVLKLLLLNYLLIRLADPPPPPNTFFLHVYLIFQDGHEICFVDEEGFRKLSVFDPEGEKLLDRYIAKDKSRE
jgi:hypothetical protein